MEHLAILNILSWRNWFKKGGGQKLESPSDTLPTWLLPWNRGENPHGQGSLLVPEGGAVLTTREGHLDGGLRNWPNLPYLLLLLSLSTLPGFIVSQWRRCESLLPRSLLWDCVLLWSSTSLEKSSTMQCVRFSLVNLLFQVHFHTQPGALRGLRIAPLPRFY